MQNREQASRNTTSVYSPTVGSAFDFPRRAAGAVPAHKLLFATLPRCGSHFICRHFFETGYAGLPLEYFNPAHWNRWRIRTAIEATGKSAALASAKGEASTLADTEFPRASNAHTFTALTRRRTGPNGCFSAKMHFSHMQTLNSIVPEAWFADAHWVRIERLDILAQVVSLDIAVQTGSWIYTQRVWRTPVYDFQALRRRMVQLLRDRHAWSKFFKERGIQQHIICYEKFAADPAANVRAVLDAYGLNSDPLPEGIVLPKIPDIKNQSSPINAEWVERFADDLGEELKALTAKIA